LILTEEHDAQTFDAELRAFRVAFQGRQFALLITDGILNQYLIESHKFPFFNPLPRINGLRQLGRATYFDEYSLNRSDLQLIGLPQEHQEFIHDAIAAGATYCVTNRPEWLRLPEQNENLYGLQIVTPSRFVQLEG
jgi:hypothetical protein